MTLTRAAFAGLALAAAGLLLTGCGAASVPQVPTVTVQVGSGGAHFGPTQVLYTCPTADGTICGPEVFETVTWTKLLTVPVGTLIRVQATNVQPDPFGHTPSCWVADATGRMAYAQSDTGSCAVEAR